MKFEESKNYKLIESILKEPNIYAGFDRYNEVPIEQFYINPSTDSRFLIGEHPVLGAVSILIIETIRTRTKIHFAITEAGRKVAKSQDLFKQSVDTIISNYPEIKAFIGSVSIDNTRSLKFYTSTNTKIIGYTWDDNMYHMELKVN